VDDNHCKDYAFELEMIPLHGRYVGEREIRDDEMHVYVCKHKLISVVRDQCS
jgi:hypothetical protein